MLLILRADWEGSMKVRWNEYETVLLDIGYDPEDGLLFEIYNAEDGKLCTVRKTMINGDREKTNFIWVFVDGATKLNNPIPPHPVPLKIENNDIILATVDEDPKKVLQLDVVDVEVKGRTVRIKAALPR
jgi:hypothetical protein